MAEKKPLSKSQLLSTLAEKTGQSKKDIHAVLEALTEVAYKEAKSVGKFTLPGFGILKLVQRAARVGRNPITGEQIKIPAKTVVKFSVAKAAKEAIVGKAPAKKK
jgi:DNA-binding protein HU-beta